MNSKNNKAVPGNQKVSGFFVGLKNLTDFDF